MGYADDGSYVVDTRTPGNASGGHAFGADLSAADVVDGRRRDSRDIAEKAAGAIRFPESFRVVREGRSIEQKVENNIGVKQYPCHRYFSTR